MSVCLGGNDGVTLILKVMRRILKVIFVFDILIPVKLMLSAVSSISACEARAASDSLNERMF